MTKRDEPTETSSRHDDMNDEDHLDVWDVIIVGAGQAGMAAAHRLIFEQDEDGETNGSTSTSPALRVLILEASDHVGGRTRNFDVDTGRMDVVSDHVIEMGGTWLSPDHTAALDLCQQHLGIDIFRASMLPTVMAQAEDALSKEPKITLQEETVEYPWWFLGPDYSEDDMNRLQRLIVHQFSEEDKCTKTVAVSNPKEFLQSFSNSTKEQLEKVGQIIEKDAASLETGGNAWELHTIGIQWHQLDSASTADERCFLSSNSLNATKPILTDPNARNIMRGVIHDKNAEEPGEVSYLYNLISWSGSNSRGPSMEFRVRGGTQAIPLTIAKKVNDYRGRHTLHLSLDTPVKSIQWEPTPGEHFASDPLCLVNTTNGKMYRSRTMIVTGAPASLRNIQFGSSTSDMLPRVQEGLLSPESSPMGRCIKFCAIYNRGAWWRQFNLQGDIVASGLPNDLSVELEPRSKDGTESLPLFSHCFDVSPYSGKYGVLCCFVEGAAYDKFHSLTIEERKNKMKAFLELSFKHFVCKSGINETKEQQSPLWEPDDFASFEWGGATPYIGGAYTSYFPPRILTRLGNWEGYQQIEKARNIFWAGADYHAGYGNGYIEGAIRGGRHAADAILERIAMPSKTPLDEH